MDHQIKDVTVIQYTMKKEPVITQNQDMVDYLVLVPLVKNQDAVIIDLVAYQMFEVVVLLDHERMQEVEQFLVEDLVINR